ncbi:hypothetical protein MA9V2_092 [Chryseobacterium phage MA9V-2]|nr:hypothetical protein MA9V2_092 [Chryseobacterium phage MA9V-2]
MSKVHFMILVALFTPTAIALLGYAIWSRHSYFKQFMAERKERKKHNKNYKQIK